MTAYVDSSALVAVYVAEQFSIAARRVLRSVAQAPFTLLHDLEVRNAFRLLAGRGLITKAERRAVTANLDQDLASQRLVHVALDLPQVFTRARELSEAYSEKILSRSLDVLHVAAALELSCSRFVSADDRQLRLARAAGLKSIDITSTRSSAAPARR